MSWLADGSSYLVGGFGVNAGGSKPFTVLGWYKRGTVGATADSIAYFGSTAAGIGDFGIRTTSNTTQVICDDYGSTVVNTPGSSLTITSGVWTPFVGVSLGVGTALKTIYTPNATDRAGGTNTSSTSGTSGAYDRIYIGARNFGGGGATNIIRSGSQVGEVAFWFGTGLGLSEIGDLLDGENPTKVRPNNLQFYYPLVDNYSNQLGPWGTLVPTGGSAALKWSDHPPVAPVAKRRHYYTGVYSVRGALAVTQANETLSSAGKVLVGGTLAATQADQTVAATAGPVVSGTLAATQAAQTLSASAGQLSFGTLAVTQANETLSSAGKVLVSGALSVTQADETVSSVGGPVVSGALAAAQAAQTLVGTASDSEAASLAITQAAQTLASTAAVLVSGTLAATQAGQTIAGQAKVLVGGSLAVTQASQTVAAVGRTTVVGTFAGTQGSQVLFSVGAVKVAGSLAATQSGHTLVATGLSASAPGGALAITQANQTLQAVGYLSTTVIGGGANFASIWQLAPRITAKVMGLPFRVYRPNGLAQPIAPDNFVASIPALIAPDKDFSFRTPNSYAKLIWYASIDPAITNVGDYLVGPLVSGDSNDTFFIASQEIPAPIQVVACNRILSFTEDGGVSTAAPGVNCYGGRTTASDKTLSANWPASVLQGTKGERSVVGLPSDTRLPWFNIALPISIPINFHTGIRTSDDLGNNYIVSSFEQTDMGWRLTASLADT